MANAHRFYVPVGVVALATPPAAPITGDTYFDTALGQLQSWDGTRWVGSSSDADLDAKYVNVAGDAMTGELLVPDQVAVPPSAPVVAAAKGYVDQVITVSDAPPDAVANAPVRDGLVWAVVSAVSGMASVSLTYGAGAVGFTVAGDYEVDWGDGSPVESFLSGVEAAHTYASGGVAVVTSTNLTSLVITPTATAPSGLSLDAPDLTHLEVASDTNLLESVVFVSPVTLDSCQGLFSGQSRLISVTGEIGSSGTDFSNMFQGCAALTTVPALDTSAGTNFRSMFNSCQALTTVPALDTSAGADFSYMFYNCQALTTVPALDTSAGTDFGGMFYFCRALTTAPALDTSAGTNFHHMFSACATLTTVPALDTSAGTNFIYMFYDCPALTTVPALDTSAGTNFSYMFQSCVALTTVPALDTSAGTDFSNMFASCQVLSSILAHGFTVAVGVDGCALPTADLDVFLGNLGTANPAGAAVDITGNPGAATCDRTIATAKGWTVTG